MNVPYGELNKMGASWSASIVAESWASALKFNISRETRGNLQYSIHEINCWWVEISEKQSFPNMYVMLGLLRAQFICLFVTDEDTIQYHGSLR